MRPEEIYDWVRGGVHKAQKLALLNDEALCALSGWLERNYEENAPSGTGGLAFEGVAPGGTRPTHWPTSITVSPLARPRIDWPRLPTARPIATRRASPYRSQPGRVAGAGARNEALRDASAAAASDDAHPTAA